MHLKQKFEAGQFAILAEMEPPKGTDVTAMVTNAMRVKGKVDAFMVPEMSNAVMRMSALGASLVLQNRGLPCVMQVCCRDRNRLALQGDLLAASACGISQVMAVAGEDTSFGDHHQTKAVYDIDLPELLQLVGQLQNGRDMAGVELSGTPTFLLGAAASTGAHDAEPSAEIEAARRKIDAGVQFLITPPVFDLETLLAFRRLLDRPHVAIVPTVLLLKSLGMARYMARNIKNVYLPDSLISRIQKAPDKVRECVTIAAEMVSQLKASQFGGVMVSTMGWEQRLPEIFEAI